MNSKLGRYGAGAALAAIGAAAIYARTTRPRLINAAVPEPAKPVDLDRYLGRWFELARNENRFERGLEAVTADYSLLPDGRVSVLNGGRKGSPDGQPTSTRGKAIVVDPATSAKLKVSFFGPFYVGNYWVLDHAEDYAWSIVGEPSGRYLWLLSRKAKPGEAMVNELLQRASALGYDVTGLKRTRH